MHVPRSFAHAVAFALGVASLGAQCGTELPYWGAKAEGRFELSPGEPGTSVPLRLRLGSPSDDAELFLVVHCVGARRDDLSLSLQDAEGRPLAQTYQSFGGDAMCAAPAETAGASGGGAGDAAPDLSPCTSGGAIWRLTNEQKGAYCRAETPAERRCELDAQTALTLRPSAFESGAAVRLSCEWSARLSHQDADHPGPLTVEVVR